MKKIMIIFVISLVALYGCNKVESSNNINSSDNEKVISNQNAINENNNRNEEMDNSDLDNFQGSIDECAEIVESKKIEDLKEYLKNYTVDLNSYTNDGKLLLEIAFSNDDFSMFEYLYSLNCSIDKASSTGETLREKIESEGSSLMRGLIGG